MRPSAAGWTPTPRSGPGSRSAETRSRPRRRRGLGGACERAEPDPLVLAKRGDFGRERVSADLDPGALRGVGVQPAADGRKPFFQDQALIFEVAESAALPAGRAFGALYMAFLGRTNGPRAGWLLAGLEQGFVVERLRAAAGWRDHANDASGGTGAHDTAGAAG